MLSTANKVIMGKFKLFICAILITLLLFGCGPAPDISVDRVDRDVFKQSKELEALLIPEDMEKVGGFPEVNRVRQNHSIGADGNLNFALPEGNIILTATIVGKPEQFDIWKSQPKLVNTVIDGTGDEAFSGPAGSDDPSSIYLRQGDYSIVLTSKIDNRDPAYPGRLYYPLDLQRMLANIMTVRLKDEGGDALENFFPPERRKNDSSGL